MRILVIEDETPLREALRIKLKDTGHEVETAVNGLVGLYKVHQFEYDLIILDRVMPIMNGDEFLEKTDFPKNKIVVLSNLLSDDKLGEGIKVFNKSGTSLSEVVDIVENYETNKI